LKINKTTTNLIFKIKILDEFTKVSS